MKTIEEIRHARLAQLLALPEYPTVQSLAKAIGRSPAQLSQWKNRSRRANGSLCNIDSESARHIEQATGHPRGWMDNDPQEQAPDSSAMAAAVARMFDRGVPEGKRLTAFWIIHEMVEKNEWPEELPASARPPSVDPYHAPTEERARSAPR